MRFLLAISKVAVRKATIFPLLLLAIYVAAVGSFACAQKNRKIKVVTFEDVPLQESHLSLEKPQQQCTHDILLGHLCWRIAAVSTEAFDGSSHSISLVVENDELSSYGMHQFGDAPIVFAIDGQVVKTQDLVWTDKSKIDGIRDSFVTLTDEGLVRKIAAASEVYVTILIDPDRMSVKISRDMIAGVKAVLDAYDAAFSVSPVNPPSAPDLQPIDAELTALSNKKEAMDKRLETACPDSAKQSEKCTQEANSIRDEYRNLLTRASALLDQRLSILTAKQQTQPVIQEEKTTKELQAKVSADLKQIESNE